MKRCPASILAPLTRPYLVSQVTKLQVAEGGSTNRVEVQVARMVVLMVLAFLLTWLPYAGMALAVVLDSTLYINPITATIPVYLAKSSTVYNPIIYIFMNRQVISPLINAQRSRKERCLTAENLGCLFVCECSSEDVPSTPSSVDKRSGSPTCRRPRGRLRSLLSARARRFPPEDL